MIAWKVERIQNMPRVARAEGVPTGRLFAHAEQAYKLHPNLPNKPLYFINEAAAQGYLRKLGGNS